MARASTDSTIRATSGRRELACPTRRGLDGGDHRFAEVMRLERPEARGRRAARRDDHLAQLARRESALGEHGRRTSDRRVRELGRKVLRQTAAYPTLHQAFREEVHERRPAAGERRHRIEEVLTGDRDGLADRLEELQGLLQVLGQRLRPRDRHRYALPDQRRGVRHDAHDTGLAPEPGLEPPEREAGRDRDEELSGVHLGTDLVEDRRHALRLHRQNDGLRAADERAILARRLDLVQPLQAPDLHVDGVARPDVVGVVLSGAQEPSDQGACHVPGADEADFLHEPSPPTEEPGRLAPGPRAPKSARPSRSNVAPSSTATRKSSLIPIERWGSSTPSALCAASRTSRRSRKCGRESSGTPGAGGISMIPSNARAGRERSTRARSWTPSGGTPPFPASPAPFTWMRTGSRRPARSASAARTAPSAAESTVWTRSKIATAARTLFRCRRPIRCHVASPPTSARLARASCT